MRVTTTCAALFAAAVLFVWMGRPAIAAPALWAVQSPAGKVYLFGTVHLLRDNVQWQSPELEAAIAQSQDLYLEIADPASISGASSVFKLGFDRAHPLSTKISKDDVALLDEAAKRYGMGNETVFEPMQPWLAFLMLSMMPATHSGYSPSNGVDVQVRKQFVDAGKPVNGLETADMQMHIFSDMSQADQIALLESALKSGATKHADAGPLDAIVNAWMSGDEDRLAALLQADQFSKSDFGARLITKRNSAWAASIAQRLQKPGTSFVSVGAAHLAGPDGVPALLAKMGFTVTRVTIAQTVAPSATSQETVAPQTPMPPATPQASPTPVPQTIEPPDGWVKKSVTLAMGGFKADSMWLDPKSSGAIVTGHLTMPSATSDLDAIAALVHDGIAAASGADSVTPAKRVKVCRGKAEGISMTATIAKVTEEIVIAISNQPYVAEYVRGTGVAENPAAVRSLLTLCAP